jgi:glycosyltransferase involved in cell wall biosynthesis
MWRKAGGPPYVVFAYGMEVWDGLAEYRRWGLVGADRVATISTYTAKRLVTGCAVNESRIRMLPPCVPDAYLTPLPADVAREKARQHWGLNGRKVILMVGRQALSESYKGADLLIRAMPAISRAVGNVACMVAGGGDGHAALKKVAQEVDVGDSVRILGAVSAPDLMSLYDACDVFVLPSKGEGFGIVLLEAAARGRPSVSLRFGGIEDAVLGGRTGLLVDRDDPADLAVAVTRVLEGDVPEHFNDPRELRRIVVDNFGFDRFRGRLADILGEILPGIRSANESH